MVAYNYISGALSQKWTASTAIPAFSPEVRGLAGGDLDGDGTVEIAATTTQETDTQAGGAQACNVTVNITDRCMCTMLLVACISL